MHERIIEKQGITDKPKILLELNVEQAKAIEDALQMFVSCGLGMLQSGIKLQVDLGNIRPKLPDMTKDKILQVIEIDLSDQLTKTENLIGYGASYNGISNPDVSESIKSAYEIKNILNQAVLSSYSHRERQSIKPELRVSSGFPPIAHVAKNPTEACSTN